MSFGDTSSLQNALDAFRAEEELNHPYSLGPEALAELAHAGGGVHRTGSQQHPPHHQRDHPWLEDGAVGSAGALRPKHRKPPLRASSSFLLRCAHNSAVDPGLQERLGMKADPNGAGHTATNNGNGLGADQSSVDWASSARGSPAPPAYGANGGVLGGLQEGGGTHAGGGGRRGIVGETAVPTTNAGPTACANGSGVVGGAAESVAEGDNDHMEGGGGTTGGRGGEEQEVGSGSRDARDATKGGPGSETCFTDTAARVHTLERELHLMRKECAQHAAARRAAEDQLIGLSQELWQARRVQAILLSRLSGSARGALEGSSLMPSGVDQATIDNALKGMLAGLGWGPEVGEMEEHTTSQQQQQHTHQQQQHQQQHQQQQEGHLVASQSQQQQQQPHQQQQPPTRGQTAFRAWHPHRAPSSAAHAHAPMHACAPTCGSERASPHSKPEQTHNNTLQGGSLAGGLGQGSGAGCAAQGQGITGENGSTQQHHNQQQHQQQQQQQGAHPHAHADSNVDNNGGAHDDVTAENDPVATSTPFSHQQAQHPAAPKPPQPGEPDQATWQAARVSAPQPQTTSQQSQQSPHLQRQHQQQDATHTHQDGTHTHTHTHTGTGTGTGTTGACSGLGACDDNSGAGRVDESGGGGEGALGGSGGGAGKGEQEVDPSVNTTTGDNRAQNDNGSGSGNTTGNSGAGGVTCMHPDSMHPDSMHPESMHPEKSPSPMHKRVRTLAPQASAQGCT